MYYEEFKLGQQFIAEPVLLDIEDIIDFANQYDPQRIHTDPEYAKINFFQDIIASGFHTLSAIWGQFIRTNPFGNEIIAGRRLNHVSWNAPVRPGDILQTVAEVVDKKKSSKGNRGIITLRLTVTNQNDVVVLTMECEALLKLKTI